MYLGIDLGTSALKVLLVDDAQRVVDEALMPLTVSRPHPSWSEQDPRLWWNALNAAIGELRAKRAREFGALRGIGLSGQMHGAVLLDSQGRPLRPCILWNDGRSAAECAELEAREPDLRRITGNLAMPGFTAPKLLWVRRHEPEAFAATHTVLLPKDYLRLCMTGARATDVSDAAGTLWLDVENRAWSERMIAATELRIGAMPELFEGDQPTAVLLPEIADAWGVPHATVVAAGAADNAAAAVGVGAIAPGDGFVSVGTSGVICQIDDRAAPNTARALHTFCHGLPGRWLQMAVILSAASSFEWLRQVAGVPESAVLADEAAIADAHSPVMFLPYLAGERTPHNDPDATGAFVGLTHRTGRGELARAVMEGVALALADGYAGFPPSASAAPLWAVGGGTRSPLWLQFIADALDRTLLLPEEKGEFGPAFGAARLARLAVTGEAAADICTPGGSERIVAPGPEGRDRLAIRLNRFRGLYDVLSVPNGDPQRHGRLTFA